MLQGMALRQQRSKKYYDQGAKPLSWGSLDDTVKVRGDKLWEQFVQHRKSRFTSKIIFYTGI